MNPKQGKAEADSAPSKGGDIHHVRKISDDPMLTAGGIVSEGGSEMPRHQSWAEIEDDRGGPTTIRGR